MLSILISPTLGSFYYLNLFEKDIYYIMYYFKLVKLQYIRFINFTNKKINLYFEKKEIKAVFLFFLFFNCLTISY